MSICTETYSAAYRYLDQLTHNKGEEFKATLASDVEQHHCRLNGVFQTQQTVCRGAAKVFELYDETLLQVTTNFDVKEWSMKCNGLVAECDYAVEEDKNIPEGPQGRYRMQGHVKLVFVQDSSSKDLKISEIWDATSAIKL